MDVETRMQRAFERVLEDPGLTADLKDEQARLLQTWAKFQVQRLVANTEAMDDAAAWTELGAGLRRLRVRLRDIAGQVAAAADPAATLEALLASADDIEEGEALPDD
ncbi:MAG: hypothetical protein RBT47_02215 [Anaerolineae bacterium]|nr:hypothetical protein [Anaerolineae bacterium]